jgi:hypothetical protein
MTKEGKQMSIKTINDPFPKTLDEFKALTFLNGDTRVIVFNSQKNLSVNEKTAFIKKLQAGELAMEAILFMKG